MLIPDRMSVIIPRQTTIPTERASEYTTVHDNQTGVDIRLFQGELRDVSKNTFLDQFHLDGIPPGPAGTEGIQITFRLDRNAVLNVKAVAMGTGRESHITVKRDFARMSSLEKEEAGGQLEAEWKRSTFLRRVEPLITSAERQLSQLEGPERTKLESILERLKMALAQNDESAVDQLDKELTDVLFELQ